MEKRYENQGRNVGKKIQGSIFNALMMPLQGAKAIHDTGERAKTDAAAFAGGLIDGLVPRPVAPPVHTSATATTPISGTGSTSVSVPPTPWSPLGSLDGIQNNPAVVNANNTFGRGLGVQNNPAVVNANAAFGIGLNVPPAVPPTVPTNLPQNQREQLSAIEGQLDQNEATNAATAATQNAAEKVAQQQADAIQAQKIANIEATARRIGGADAAASVNLGEPMGSLEREYGGARRNLETWRSGNAGNTLNINSAGKGAGKLAGQMRDMGLPFQMTPAIPPPRQVSDEEMAQHGHSPTPTMARRQEMAADMALANFFDAPGTGAKSQYASMDDYNKGVIKSGDRAGWSRGDARMAAAIPTDQQTAQKDFFANRDPGESFKQYEKRMGPVREREAMVKAQQMQAPPTVAYNPAEDRADMDALGKRMAEIEKAANGLAMTPDQAKNHAALMGEYNKAYARIIAGRERSSQPQQTQVPPQQGTYSREEVIAAAKKANSTPSQIAQRLGLAWDEDAGSYKRRA
jgi:hypothetical protein